ncbi:MAG TPA: hypothetical protein ENK05_09725 [Gammaproteobacteria bacterium]|nr:hypothetical protein [Gammaproteobacteria bacterium]
MKTESILSPAAAGIRQALQSARTHAAQIVSTGRDDQPGALVEPLIGLRQDRLQLQASARVLKAADEMIGTLFDQKT